jgi:hypothetical protein
LKSDTSKVSESAPKASGTVDMAISGIPRDTFEQFMTRAKRDGWFSKNELIVALLREPIEVQSTNIHTKGGPR